MVRYQIPKAYFPGFEILINLVSSDLEKIASFLKSISVGTGLKRFIQQFSEAFPETPENNLLAATIFSLGGFKSSEQEDGVEGLVQGLKVSYQEQAQKQLTEQQQAQLEENLRIILNSNQQLSSTYKAFSLLTESNRVYREAHVITDIRLLFKEEITDNERYGLVIHQLKVEVEENGEIKEYYFSLSGSDLSKLQIQLTRAVDKEKLIKDNYGSFISFVEVTD